MLNEIFVSYFEVLDNRFAGGTKKIHKKPQDNWFSGQGSDSRPIEYKAGLLNTKTQR
jgi:hypothetical protein